MSAYVVHPAHIHYLVSAAVFGPPYQRLRFGEEYVTSQNATRVGAALLAENVASVRYRYPDDEYDDLPGPIPTPSAVDYDWSPRFDVDPVQAIKAIHCYRYQSCEHPGWRESAARRFCDDLEAALIRSLPGYEAAEWEITE